MTYVPNGSTLAGRASTFISMPLRLRAFMSSVRRLMGLSHKYPKHGCTDLLRYFAPSQEPVPLFTELHTAAQRRQLHVGVLEFLLPFTQGQTGISPVESAQSSIHFM